MANIDRIEELMCKHIIDAIGLSDENGHFKGTYEIDADHFLELLEHAEHAEKMKEKLDTAKFIGRQNNAYGVNQREDAEQYKQALESIKENSEDKVAVFIARKALKEENK